MPNLTLLGVSCSPLSTNGQNMAFLLSKHGPHMVLQIGFPESQSLCPGMLHATFHNSGGILSPFLRNGQNMAPLWPKPGPHLFLHIGSSWISAMCLGLFRANFHIAWCILYPPIRVLAKIWPFYGQNMTLTWSFKLVLPESGMFDSKFHNSGCPP